MSRLCPQLAVTDPLFQRYVTGSATIGLPLIGVNVY
jgi:hypothetical protein